MNEDRQSPLEERDGEPNDERNGEPAAQSSFESLLNFNPYLIVAYLSLGVIFLALAGQGSLVGNFAIVTIGVMGLVLRLRMAPMLLLASLAAMELVAGIMFDRFRFPRRPMLFDPMDIALCMGVLAYVVCHFRLQSIWLNTLTPDPRRRPGPLPFTFFGFPRPRPIPMQKRSPSDEVTRGEVVLLLMSLPLWCIAAQVLLMVVGVVGMEWRILGLPDRLSIYVFLIWLLTFALLMGATIFNHWKRRHMSKHAAQVALQDMLWQETRGDQRRINRWLAWFKLHKRKP